jgi:hypothetical protein
VTEFDKVVPPGGVGKVTAAIHTTSFKGPITKSVTVTTNDPDHRTFALTLKAMIAVPIDVQPSENVSFMGRYDELKPHELTLVASDGKPFDITSATLADPTFKVAVEATPETGTAEKPKAGTLASGSSKYKVTITPPANPKVGRVTTTLDIATTQPKSPTLAIRIIGSISGDITYAPQTVMLMGGASATAEQKEAKILLQKPEGDPLKVLGATANNPALKPSYKMVKDGREYEVTVKYDGPALVTALNAVVTVQTNDKRQPTVEIPVWGRTDPAPRADVSMPPGALPGATPIRITPVAPKKEP